ncbi:MAG: response regulator [Phycisphaerae bacterium]|nr:response regulator [Phycisphaerae bacterium]
MSVPCLEGEPRLVAGVVVRCAHLRGQLHEIGVVFDSLIDLGQHIDPNQARVILGEATEWPRFSGKVLYVDASVDACELARFLLAKLGLGLHAATSLAEGLGLLSGNEFRLVAVGIEGTGLDEMAPAGTLRERGYDGPIVACIQVDTPEARKEALAAGFTAVIAKPFDFKSWSNVVRERLSGHFAS